jgi:pyrroloquinoline quinone (PQQ) biosynthesis protein C
MPTHITVTVRNKGREYRMKGRLWLQWAKAVGMPRIMPRVIVKQTLSLTLSI